MAELTGGQAVVAALKAEGIDAVFGIVGTHNVPIFDALYDAPELRLVVPRHEQGAAMMADGYARASGRLAACVTVPGPGLTNALTGVGQAYSDSSPLLLISAQIESHRLDHDFEDFHELRDSLQVAGTVTGCSTRALRVEDVAPAVQRAARATRVGRPRPAYVEIPMDVLFARGQVELLPPLDLPPAAGDPSAVARAAALLQAAARPLLYVGGGAQRAAPEVLRLAERLQMPVLSSLQGKGVMSDDHPLGLGDGWARLPLFQDVLQEADLALAIGARFDVVSDGTQGQSLPERLIHLDIDPTVIGRHRPATLPLLGDSAATLRQLLEALPAAPRSRCWLDTARVKAAKRAYLAERAGPVQQILDLLRAALPPEAIVVSDLNLVGYWAEVGFEVYQPRTYLHNGSYGCLGFAVPAAIGAKVAQPDRPAVAISGDGGFLYTCAELGAAAQQGLGVVALVFNDRSYGALKTVQDRRFGGRRIGVDLGDTDFPSLARAVGADGLRLSAPSELGPALREAIEQQAATLIEVPLEVEGRAAIPPWMPE